MTSGTPPFDEWKMHALILVERITGGRLTAEWLSREHARFVQGPHARERIEACLEALRTGSAREPLLGVPLGR